jgi:hypothetical protein
MQDQGFVENPARDGLPAEKPWRTRSDKPIVSEGPSTSSFLVSVFTALAIGFLIWMILKGQYVG